MFEVVYADIIYSVPSVLQTFHTEEEANHYLHQLLKNAFEYEAMNYWVRKKP